MGTSFSEIFDLFMQQLSDYRLIDLYNTPTTGISNFETYLTGFLILATRGFDPCTQNLSDRNDSSKEFNFIMTEINKIILSKFMVKEWLGKEVNDILQMRLHVQDDDFKTFAEANNLNAKKSSYDKLNEDCSQAMVDYGFKNLDWASWFAGNFVG